MSIKAHQMPLYYQGVKDCITTYRSRLERIADEIIETCGARLAEVEADIEAAAEANRASDERANEDKND